MKVIFKNMPVIKKENRWNSDDVVSMCIRNQYYTAGDAIAYQEMLDYVDATAPDDDNLYKVAYDIVKHSHLNSGQTEVEDIQSIMFNLKQDCVYTFYELLEFPDADSEADVE